jgi:hypothetical protein
MFLQRFIESGGRSLIPLKHYASDPSLGSELRLETDLAKVPQKLRSRVMIGSADGELRRQLEGRGFFTIEAMPQVYLMERQFPDNVLDTSPDAFSKFSGDCSIPQSALWG